MKLTKQTATERAVIAAGGPTLLAKEIGEPNHQTVVSWVKNDRVRAEKVLLVEDVQSEVSRYELRPDVFGPVPTAEMIKEIIMLSVKHYGRQPIKKMLDKLVLM